MCNGYYYSYSFIYYQMTEYALCKCNQNYFYSLQNYVPCSPIISVIWHYSKYKTPIY